MGTVNENVDRLSCHLCTVELGANEIPGVTKICFTDMKTSHLWSYLYHQNVRESISFGGGSGLDNLPQLSFTLASGRGATDCDGNSPESHKFCLECSGELGRLDKLHQELEGIKKKIESQVRRINRRRMCSNTDGQAKNLFPSPSELQVSLAGCVTGKDSISQALGFLTTVCNGIPHERPPSIAQFPAKVESCSDAPLTSDDQLVEHDLPQDYLDANMQIEKAEMPIFVGTLIKTEPDHETSLSENLVVQTDVPSDSIHLNQDSIESFLPLHDDIDDPGVMPLEDPLAVPVIIGRVSLTSSEPARKRLKSDNVQPLSVPKSKYTTCEICGKVMLTKNTSSHMIVHTGERKYGCPDCGMKFTHVSSVKRHRIRAHGVDWDNCEVRYTENSN